MSTSIVDLLNHVGVENVRVQFLADCAIDASASSKQGVTRVTFMTENMTVSDLIRPGENVGMVVWVPRNLVPGWALSKEAAK